MGPLQAGALVRVHPSPHKHRRATSTYTEPSHISYDLDRSDLLESPINSSMLGDSSDISYALGGVPAKSPSQTPRRTARRVEFTGGDSGDENSAPNAARSPVVALVRAASKSGRKSSRSRTPRGKHIMRNLVFWGCYAGCDVPLKASLGGGQPLILVVTVLVAQDETLNPSPESGLNLGMGI